MASRWDQALVRVASAKDPTALPTDDKVLFYDERTITIFDKFPKARYHFLVLPRIPFRAQSGGLSAQSARGTPMLSAANGRLNFGATGSNVVPTSHLKSISSLLASPYAAEVLETLRKTSDRVLQHVQNDMREHYGVVWDTERAFHAVPSMVHLHLHVVSMDLVSDRLKHKKHFISFHPKLGFALQLDAVEEMVRQGRQSLPKSEQSYEQLLRGPLTSHHTGQTFRVLPELKAHLESYWHEILLADSRAADRGAVAETSTKRGSGHVDLGKATTGRGSTDQRPSQSRKTSSARISEVECAADQRSPSPESDELSLPTR